MNAYFPKENDRFRLQGASGLLEVAVDMPREPNVNEDAPLVVVCHPHPLYQGTMDNKVVVTVQRAMNQLGLICIRFNYRGVGQSDGVYGEGEGEIEDCLTVLNWLASHFPKRKIWLTGFSFGGYIAYRASKLHPLISQLLCIAPGITRFNMSGLAEPHVPFVVIQSDQDEVIAYSAVTSWLMRHDCPFHFIKLAGVSHFFHGRLVELKRLLIETYQPRLLHDAP